MRVYADCHSAGSLTSLGPLLQVRRPRYGPGAEPSEEAGWGRTLFEPGAETGDAALRAVPVRTHVVLVGVHSSATPTDLHALLHKEVSLTGSLSHSRADFARAVERLARTPETFRPVIGRRAPLESAAAGLVRLAHTQTAGKLLVGGQEAS